MRRAQWFAIAIFLIAASVYLPTLDDPALNWDDPEYIELPLLQQPDALAQIWTSFATPQVYPVVFTSFWIDTLLWKGDLRGTRAVDLLLHGLVGVLAFCFLRSILGRRFGEGPAFVTALLFALHPTQVATVAWIAERKNLLAAIFVLLALMACRRATMRADGRPARREWTAAYVFGFLAMFSKSTAVVLPLLVLWMEAWIPARRPAAADVGGSGRWRSL
ncbi:MAG: glycosyltransferase family 39 protein, partial [Candidatus Eisenbacteria bacterium]|nr:glycosyltransferase family 39 protein [Candidatus Eisenbacteria bacterium]